ncbi:MAG TPA: hypothetical protein VF017_15270 [Thermoanaerobaculia bacterium]|nr:hypothetical protein [Thermoanaerobaculia bacterium]
MSKSKVLGLMAFALLLTAATAQAQLLGKEAQLFVPIKSLGSDAHYQDHERFAIGDAVTPEGALSEGMILGPTRAGSTVLGGPGGRWFAGGKALVIVNGRASIQTTGSKIDDIPAGSGYSATFKIPVSEIQFEVVAGSELDIEVQGLYMRRPLAAPQVFHVNPGSNLFKFGTNGVFWDTIQIRSVKDSAGWGLDNIGVGGVMLARPVVCREVN